MTIAHSIRAQLTFLATGVVALLVLIFAMSSYAWFRAELEAELQSFARHEAEEVGHIVAGARTPAELVAMREALDQLLPEVGILAVNVWSLDGELVYRNPESTPFSEPWPEGLAAARTQGPIFETLQPAEGPKALGTAVLVSFGREPRWVVSAFVARDRADASLAAFRRFSLLGFTLTSLLMLAASGIIVTRALRPVQQLVHDAQVISREGPGQRLAQPPAGSELAELVTLLNQMLEQTEASLERLRRFTAHASHELRTPLTRIRGELESALADDRPDAAREALGGVLEEVESLRGIIDGLLELAHSDEPLVGDGSDVDLTALVEELAEQARLVGLEREVRVEIEAPPHLEVPGSRSLLARAIWNLLDNALRFSPVGGRIRARLTRLPDRRVSLEVEDEGPGLGASPERVFEPFVRGERQPERAAVGYGLGLALSRAIVQRHGGQLVALQPGELCGARLRFELPGE